MIIQKMLLSSEIFVTVKQELAFFFFYPDNEYALSCSIYLIKTLWRI